MYAECQELLQLFGLPYIIAPTEAEAQCAWLDINGLVDGVVTDDNDAFLFGALRVYRNIFESVKYVEEYRSAEIESELGLGRENLVTLGMLLGSDYTAGVAGVGVVNALEVVRAFGGFEGMKRFYEWMVSVDDEIVALMMVENGGGGGGGKKGGKKKKKTPCPDQEKDDGGGGGEDGVHENPGTSVARVNASEDSLRDVEAEEEFKSQHKNARKTWTLPSNFGSDEIIDAYMNPKIDDSKERFVFGRPDLELLRRFCAQKFGWEAAKTDELLLPVLRAYDERQTQQTLDNFVSYRERFAKFRSKRLAKAVSGMKGRDGGGNSGRKNNDDLIVNNENGDKEEKKGSKSKKKPRNSKHQDGAASAAAPRKRCAVAESTADANTNDIADATLVHDAHVSAQTVKKRTRRTDAAKRRQSNYTNE